MATVPALIDGSAVLPGACCAPIFRKASAVDFGLLGPPTCPLSQSHPRPNQPTRDCSLHVLIQLGGCCFPNMCGVRRAANRLPTLAVSLPQLRDQWHPSWHPPSTSSPRSRPQIRRWPRNQDRSLSCHTTCCVRTSLLTVGLVMRYFKVPTRREFPCLSPIPNNVFGLSSTGEHAAKPDVLNHPPLPVRRTS